MASARDITRRIKSVKNTQQITKAMKMVSSVRLRRAQEKALATAPYTNKLEELLHNVADGATDPLMEKRETIRRTGYIIVGADKGLAGAFSSNILKTTLKVLEKHNAEEYDVMTVGRKPAEAMKHYRIHVSDSMSGFSDKPSYEHAKLLAEKAVEKFLAQEVDEVYVVYTHFISALQQEVKVERLLPAAPVQGSDETKRNEEYIFVPDAKQVFTTLLPQYINMVLYNALLQSAASELGSRMTAMTAATDNAGELIDKLTLNYNKVRQASITNEISEIVGGANALE